MLLTGKGGVGKSTVAAALAVEAARRGKRPLIVELGHRASMQEIFGVDAIGHAPVALTGGVHALNLDHDEALFDYVAQTVKIRRLARAVTANPTLGRLFRAAPAVREVLTLDALRALERAVDGRGRPRWDPILVDLDATGHALMLLEMPQVLGRLLSGGPLRRLVDGAIDLFADPARTQLCLVTLPAEIPVQETLELRARLRELGVPVGAVFVNQVPDPPLAAEHRALLPEVAARAEALRQGALTADLRLADRALARSDLAHRLVAQLRRELDVPLGELPRLPAGVPPGSAALQRLGAAALDSLLAGGTCP